MGAEHMQEAKLLLPMYSRDLVFFCAKSIGKAPSLEEYLIEVV